VVGGEAARGRHQARAVWGRGTSLSFSLSPLPPSGPVPSRLTESFHQAHNNTDECRALLAASEWTLANFVGALVADPEALLAPGARRGGTNATTRDTLPEGVVRGDANASATEALLWDGPDAAWVACSQVIFPARKLKVRG
jgi:hypothetical protein